MDTPKTERAKENEPIKEQEGVADAKLAKKSAEVDTKKSSVKSKPKRHKNNVRKLRMEQMMSKAELARRAGLSTLTIDRVEKGMPCRMDTKRKILEALGLTPSDRVNVFGEDY
jgi:DNA-binding XRE family transcriptional regulator